MRHRILTYLLQIRQHDVPANLDVLLVEAKLPQFSNVPDEHGDAVIHALEFNLDLRLRRACNDFCAGIRAF